MSVLGILMAAAFTDALREGNACLMLRIVGQLCNACRPCAACLVLLWQGAAHVASADGNLPAPQRVNCLQFTHRNTSQSVSIQT